MIGPGPARMLSTMNRRFSEPVSVALDRNDGPGPPTITDLCNTNSVEPPAKSMPVATLPRTKVFSRRIRLGFRCDGEDSARINSNNEPLEPLRMVIEQFLSVRFAPAQRTAPSA